MWAEIFDSLSKIKDVAMIVRDRFKKMDRNDKHLEQILVYMEDLKKLFTELLRQVEHDVPPSLVTECRSKIHNLISLRKSICKSMSSQSDFKRFINVSSAHDELVQLERDIQHAYTFFQILMQFSTYNQCRQPINENTQETQEVTNIVQRVQPGIYLNPSVNRPTVVKNFNVSPTSGGDLVELKWKSLANDSENIDRYEIQYDDGRTLKTLSFLTSELTVHNDIYSLRLGEPCLVAGRNYAVKVRAVSRSGPGEWSENLTFHFRAGPPVRPRKPKLVVTSPTEVEVEVKIPSSRDREHDSPVTHYEVQYIRLQENNHFIREWSSTSRQQVQTIHTQKIKIGSLEPTTKYIFRVIMINSNGQSEPSEGTIVVTQYQIPGPPNSVRISRKRSTCALKVRWGHPICNPEGVKYYKVQYRQHKSIEWLPSATLQSSSFSHKVINLRSGTRYEFQIKALNHNNEGNASEIVQGTTLDSAMARAILKVSGSVAAAPTPPSLLAAGFTILRKSLFQQPQSQPYPQPYPQQWLYRFNESPQTSDDEDL